MNIMNHNYSTKATKFGRGRRRKMRVERLLGNDGILKKIGIMK